LEAVKPEVGLGDSGIGASTLTGGGDGGIVGSGIIRGIDARFHEGDQPLNVQAGKGLLFAALGVLDLCPPGLASLVNRQSYYEGNSSLCFFFPQGGRGQLRVLCFGPHGLPCFRQGSLGLSPGLLDLDPCLALPFDLRPGGCQGFLGFGQHLFRFQSGPLLVFGPGQGCFDLGPGFFKFSSATLVSSSGFAAGLLLRCGPSCAAIVPPSATESFSFPLLNS